MKAILSTALIFFTGLIFGQKIDFQPDDLHSVFWKIKHPESKTVSYLYGTIHLIDNEKFLLPKMVEKKLLKSDILYLEIADLEDQSNVMKLSMLETGRMTDILNKEQRDSLYVYTEVEFGMDSAKYEMAMGKFKPFLFAQLPMMKLMGKTKSYDLTFSSIAEENQIEKSGFETVEEQMGFFDDMSEALKVEMVMSTIRKNKGFDAEWEEMQNHYLKQNLPALLEMGSGDAQTNDFLQNVIKDNRNEKWIERLEKELLDKNAFIAVGAAHLPGQKGLINLLIQKGYDVSPIKIQLTQ